jgi:hypothetical protein
VKSLRNRFRKPYRSRTGLGTRIAQDVGVSLCCLSPIESALGSQWPTSSRPASCLLECGKSIFGIPRPTRVRSTRQCRYFNKQDVTSKRFGVNSSRVPSGIFRPVAGGATPGPSA